MKDNDELPVDETLVHLERSISKEEELAQRLDASVIQHAVERARLAELVSQLQEENDNLKKHIQNLEELKQIRQAEMAKQLDYSDGLDSFNLDFSLPRENIQG